MGSVRLRGAVFQSCELFLLSVGGRETEVGVGSGARKGNLPETLELPLPVSGRGMPPPPPPLSEAKAAETLEHVFYVPAAAFSSASAASAFMIRLIRA